MTNQKIKISHLSSVHGRYDVRIFLKMCKSLSLKGFDVSFVVADGYGDEIKDGVLILDIGKASSRRLSRMTSTVKYIFDKAKSLNSDIYHLHDPELIPIGLKLKSLGKKVIFDVHENISLDIIDKEYIPNFFRKIISFLYKKYEERSLINFDALILAEKSYLKYYYSLNKKVKVVQNMPDLKMLNNFKNIYREKNEIFYIGDISNIRGFDVSIKALKILKDKVPNFFMHYIGRYDESLIKSANLNEINENIKFYGEMPLWKGLEYSKNAKVGLSILKPIKNYKESYSTKIFEYMAIGLPVVTSDFKLYKKVIEKYDCGICVNPLNPNEIAKAIEEIIINKERSKRMGLNGMKVVENIFNWELEKKELFEVYKNL